MRLLRAATLVVAGCAVHAQTPDSAKTIADLEDELAAHIRLLADWGGLVRYGSENAELRPPAPGVDRVVFIGDDITEMWGRGTVKFFPGKPYLNRGISRQTTPQMLVRFRQERSPNERFGDFCARVIWPETQEVTQQA